MDLVRADNSLDIVWEDGSRSHFSGSQLRWACPCAECRGEAGIPGRLDHAADLAANELQVTNVGLIGQYALQVGFDSGHDTGIYTFRYLRGLQAPAG